MTTNEQKKHYASVRRKFLAIYNDLPDVNCREDEVDYRKWEHDQRMMWSRENDGTNQCVPVGGWATILKRISA